MGADRGVDSPRDVPGRPGASAADTACRGAADIGTGPAEAAGRAAACEPAAMGGDAALRRELVAAHPETRGATPARRRGALGQRRAVRPSAARAGERQLFQFDPQLRPRGVRWRAFQDDRFEAAAQCVVQPRSAMAASASSDAVPRCAVATWVARYDQGSASRSSELLVSWARRRSASRSEASQAARARSSLPTMLPREPRSRLRRARVRARSPRLRAQPLPARQPRRSRPLERQRAWPP